MAIFSDLASVINSAPPLTPELLDRMRDLLRPAQEIAERAPEYGPPAPGGFRPWYDRYDHVAGLWVDVRRYPDRLRRLQA